jgi:predicted SAM-dependent methyltransferase
MGWIDNYFRKEFRDRYMVEILNKPKDWIFETNKTILVLGCGEKPHNGAVHVDIVQTEFTDVIYDLNIFPYPFKNEQFEIIYAEDILEHLDDPFEVMEEIHRILKQNGTVHIRVPAWDKENAYTDMSHKHQFTKKSFDYYDFVTEFGNKYDYYTKAKFKIIKVEEDGADINFELKKR